MLIPVTEVQVRASHAKDMESHFLWELIHLRSQLQRRSEKVYVLSNSTSDFRNAFLKTIRQIIRESVRNMSIPSAKHAALGSHTLSSAGRLKAQQGPLMGGIGGPREAGQLPPGSAATLGKRPSRQQQQQQQAPGQGQGQGARRKYAGQPGQRQSVERESSLEDAREPEGEHGPRRPGHQHPKMFRTRSKTVSDATGERAPSSGRTGTGSAATRS